MSLISRLFGSDQQQAARVEPPMVAAAGETSGTSKPAGWLSDTGWGSQSRVKTLPRVSATIAQKHATVTACCSVLAGDTSKVPLLLKRRKDDGEEEVIQDHPLVYLVNVESSNGVPASVLRFTLAYAFTLRGNAFAYTPRDGAGVAADLRRIYGVATADLAAAEINGFEEKWAGKHASIA